MTSEGASRRRLLAAIGFGAITVAGCSSLLNEGRGGSNDDDDDEEGDQWPAVEAGELLSDFEDLDRWNAVRGDLGASEEEARRGSQAAVLENDEGSAAINIGLDGMDFAGWDTSLAVKPESVDRILVEFIAPDSDHRVASVRFPPNGHADGWFRVDAGYEHMPYEEADISNVQRMNIIADGPDDGETRMLVDDLRRTQGVDTGSAVLAFYGARESHWEHGAELLESHEWPAAVATTPRRVGRDGRMDTDQIEELQDRGWEICAYPRGHNLSEQSEDEQRRILESTRRELENRGFEDGARHFFSPDWRTLTPMTHALAREVYDAGFLRGGCPSGVPPTGTHTVSAMWGPAIQGGVRRRIDLAAEFGQLVVIRIPDLVRGNDKTENNMSVGQFNNLLDHLEDREMDVVTPSDVVE